MTRRGDLGSNIQSSRYRRRTWIVRKQIRKFKIVADLGFRYWFYGIKGMAFNRIL
jgi:hypothetical protein